jgi:hypothetical protein
LYDEIFSSKFSKVGPEFFLHSQGTEIGMKEERESVRMWGNGGRGKRGFGEPIGPIEFGYSKSYGPYSESIIQ